jgi:ABC-type Na+ efflux pump permease subunit
MTALDGTRIQAVVRKELRDYRRRRSIVVTMSVLPCIFLLNPVLTIFLTSATTASHALDQTVRLSLIFFLIIPVIMPSALAAYSVVGEREQGTLEPLLTTPIRREELILGKAAAIMIPTVALSYLVFGLFLAATRLFADSVVASALFHQGPILLALLLFTPLLAGWSIVVGMAISVRASEIRVAQQLGMLASVPLIGLFLLLAVGVINPTFLVAILFALGLLVIDVRASRVVARMFDRERLVTGAKAARP